MDYNKFEVKYIDIDGNVCFEIVRAVDELSALDIVKTALQVDEIVSVRVVPWVLLPE